MQDIFDKIVTSERYLRNIQYGQPRRGHAEGSVAAHIVQLEDNLEALSSGLKDGYYWKLKVLIHVHDSFKAETAAFSKKNCAIEDPQSHASLAKEFLAQYCDDPDMLNILQYHDLGYAVYRKLKDKGRLDEARLTAGLSKIQDLNLYLLFCIIDSCTVSKGREMITWFVQQVNRLYPQVSVGEDYILPGPLTVGESW